MAHNSQQNQEKKEEAEQIELDQFEEIEECAPCSLPVKSCKKNNCFQHKFELISKEQTEKNIFSLQEILRLCIYQGTDQELVFILNRHPEILCAPLDRDKELTPLAYARALKTKLQKNIHNNPDHYEHYGAPLGTFQINTKISSIKLLIWKQKFKKDYQAGKIQLPPQLPLPLHAIIVGYLVEPCKPSQQSNQNKQNQLEKK